MPSLNIDHLIMSLALLKRMSPTYLLLTEISIPLVCLNTMTIILQYCNQVSVAWTLTDQLLGSWRSDKKKRRCIQTYSRKIIRLPCTDRHTHLPHTILCMAVCIGPRRDDGCGSCTATVLSGSALTRHISSLLLNNLAPAESFMAGAVHLTGIGKCRSKIWWMVKP